jgi:hypothetical protein
MAQQTALTLDGAAYNPRGVSGGIATWGVMPDTDFGGGLALLTERVQGPHPKTGQTRVLFSFQVPKLLGADSACGCAGDVASTAYANVEVVIPGNFTAAERVNLRQRIQALVAATPFNLAIDSLEPSW